MELSIDNITVIIAFALPGAVAMMGISQFSATARGWLQVQGQNGASVGGALLFIFASLVAGLLVDAIRAHTVDHVHHFTGVVQPTWALSDIDKDEFEKFQGAISNHFLYHQFYGNTFICIVFAYFAWHVSRQTGTWRPGWLEVAVVVLLVFAWLGSRSDLQACYDRISELAQ